MIFTLYTTFFITFDYLVEISKRHITLILILQVPKVAFSRVDLSSTYNYILFSSGI